MFGIHINKDYYILAWVLCFNRNIDKTQESGVSLLDGVERAERGGKSSTTKYRREGAGWHVYIRVCLTAIRPLTRWLLSNQPGSLVIDTKLQIHRPDIPNKCTLWKCFLILNDLGIIWEALKIYRYWTSPQTYRTIISGCGTWEFVFS